MCLHSFMGKPPMTFLLIDCTRLLIITASLCNQTTHTHKHTSTCVTFFVIPSPGCTASPPSLLFRSVHPSCPCICAPNTVYHIWSSVKFVCGSNQLCNMWTNGLVFFNTKICPHTHISIVTKQIIWPLFHA